jgi:uncharacterized repeat protein (TIGR02543 family)
MKKLTVLTAILACALVAAPGACSNSTDGRIYTITFNSNRGDTVERLSVPQGGTVTQPADPARGGYVFGGWYKDNGTFSLPWGFGTDAVTTNITLYAKWLTQAEANAEDFGEGAAVEPPLTVNDAEGWDRALSTIYRGGNNKNYIITVNGDSTYDGASVAASFGFGFVSNIKVSLRGSGSLTLGGYGASIRVQENQTLILRGPALKGTDDNSNSLVAVSGTAFMKSGSISGNRSTHGGGVEVYNGGTFTMSGGTISGNSFSYGGGGGVHVGGGTFIMSGGTISGNSAGKIDGYYGNGGGVNVDFDGSFTMSGGTISGNSANTGGGVEASVNGSFTMNGGTISGNSASGGGGVCIGRSYNRGSYRGTFDMNGGIISDNSAGDGGGVYIHYGTFAMSGGAISGNSAVSGYGNGDGDSDDMDAVIGLGNGGGVYARGSGTTFTMNGGAISGNSASGSYDSSYMGMLFGSGNGGGVYASGGSFTMTSGTISGNSASGSYGNDSDIGALLGNSNGNGGGVYAGGGTFTMSGGTISGNSASGNYGNGSYWGGFFGNGGGVYASGYGTTFDMSGGTISGNSASGSYDNDGGEASDRDNSDGMFTAIDFGNGGGVCGTFTMNGGNISGNSAAGSYGNGSHDNFTEGPVFSTVERPFVSITFGNGGGVYGTFTMSGGTISGNSASGSYSSGSGEVSVSDNSGRAVSLGNGGGVYGSFIFTKTGSVNGGTIYGSDAGASNRNRAAGDGKGHVVYTPDLNPTLPQYRDLTAGPEDIIDTRDGTGLQ